MMSGYPLRFEENPIRKEVVESMMGEIVDFNDITVTETDSFQRGNKSIDI